MDQEKKVKRTQNRYSVAFKMKIVDEIENGLITTQGATRLYGVPNATIIGWVKQYGINTQIDKVVYIMTNEDQRELLRLRVDNRRLTKALDDSHLNNLALESLIEIVEDTYGIDVKKNIGSQLAQELKKKLRPSGSKVLE